MAVAEGGPIRRTGHISKRFDAVVMAPWGSASTPVGGWTLSQHHLYDPASRTLYLGTGERIEEAQTLARFDHRNIVRVYRYFRANNTGYMVLHFEEGQSLKSWLKNLRRAPRQSSESPRPRDTRRTSRFAPLGQPRPSRHGWGMSCRPETCHRRHS